MNHQQNNSARASVNFMNVTKRYGEVSAIDDVSFKIESGQLVTLLGPSGCGKTTTLRLIAGLEYATEGKIIIGENDVTHRSATDRNVSMVFQSYALFPHMKVLENVAYGLNVSGVLRNEARDKAKEGLALVGLSGLGDRLPSELSGGQQQRVAIARAIVLEPEVLLLDEPLSNLDAKLRRHVREEIRKIQLDLGLTTVYVTHDQEEAMAVSDQIIVMKNAVIAQQGTPRELYRKPNSRFMADFIGDANILPCEVSAISDGSAQIVLNQLPISTKYDGRSIDNGNLIVRPNQIELKKPGQENALKGSISFAAYLGNHLQYDVKLESGESLFVVDRVMSTEFTMGDEVSVIFDHNNSILIPPE